MQCPPPIKVSLKSRQSVDIEVENLVTGNNFDSKEVCQKACGPEKKEKKKEEGKNDQDYNETFYDLILTRHQEEMIYRSNY